MKHNSSTGRRLVEAFYDPKSGTTFVRHPEKEDEWLAVELLEKVLKGHPVASVTGLDACDIFSSVGRAGQQAEPKKLSLLLTHKDHHSELD